MLCYAALVVVNHGRYADLVIGNRGVLCSASGCESWYVMMSQWLCIMVCNTEQMVSNHGVLY